MIAGPSPRGWGERDAHVHERKEIRTIPTRVGRTMGQSFWVTARTDHPHAGGENGFSAKPAEPMDGPSPRGWGELAPVHGKAPLVRTIPTRVGRTGFPRLRSW